MGKRIQSAEARGCGQCSVYLTKSSAKEEGKSQFLGSIKSYDLAVIRGTGKNINMQDHSLVVPSSVSITGLEDTLILQGLGINPDP